MDDYLYDINEFPNCDFDDDTDDELVAINYRTTDKNAWNDYTKERTYCTPMTHIENGYIAEDDDEHDDDLGILMNSLHRNCSSKPSRKRRVQRKSLVEKTKYEDKLNDFNIHYPDFLQIKNVYKKNLCPLAEEQQQQLNEKNDNDEYDENNDSGILTDEELHDANNNDVNIKLNKLRKLENKPFYMKESQQKPLRRSKKQLLFNDFANSDEEQQNHYHINGIDESFSHRYPEMVEYINSIPSDGSGDDSVDKEMDRKSQLYEQQLLLERAVMNHNQHHHTYPAH